MKFIDLRYRRNGQSGNMREGRLLCLILLCVSLDGTFTLSLRLSFPFAGVQIAYFTIIGTQLFMVILSIVLLFGIMKVSQVLIFRQVISMCDGSPLSRKT